MCPFFLSLSLLNWRTREREVSPIVLHPKSQAEKTVKLELCNVIKNSGSGKLVKLACTICYMLFGEARSKHVRMTNSKFGGGKKKHCFSFLLCFVYQY